MILSIILMLFTPYFLLHVYKVKSGYKIASMPWYFNITLHNRYNIVVVGILGYVVVWDVVVVGILGYVVTWDVVVIGVLGDGVVGDTVEMLMDEGIEAILGMGGLL